jgi:hypothetical protein
LSKIVRGIEEQIKKAIAEGKFDNLPGQGKPLDLDGYFQAPEHLRMGYSILKNGNFVPEEVQLLKDIEALREQLKSCFDKTQKDKLAKAINEKTLSFTMLMERNKRAR